MSDSDAGWFGTNALWLFAISSKRVCMLGLQYLLLKTHRARKVLPIEVVPSKSELYAAVACFWLAYLGSIKTLDHAVRGLVWILSQLRVANSYDVLGKLNLRSSVDVASSQEFQEAKLGLQAFNLVVQTWQLHQLTIFVLDITIPSIKKLNTKPKATLQTLYSRANAVVAFFQLITIGQTPLSIPLKICPPDEAPTSLTIGQEVHLQRKQNSSPKKGRTLSWNLTIDKQALDEMKETLGPPGGFGELGFCVGKDEVKFEAMGVGTSFGLVFGVEEEGERAVSKLVTRQESKGKRRKPK